jgi:hypothetical protein
MAGSCEHSNEPSDSIKGREFLDWVTISFSRTLLHEVSDKPLECKVSFLSVPLLRYICKLKPT